MARGQVKAFNEYLVTYQVGGIVPTWQLLRTATSWQRCGAQPFEVPPTAEWPHIVQTLRYIRDYVIPAVGPVEPVSGYRNPTLNVCAGGAPESAHKALFGDRHGAAAPDHARAADADLVRRCTSARGSDYRRRARLLRLTCASTSTRTKYPPLEHGSGGRRPMPADRPSGGHRDCRPASALGRSAGAATGVARARTRCHQARAGSSALGRTAPNLVLLRHNAISLTKREGFPRNGLRKAHRSRARLPAGGADHRGPRASPADRAGASAEGAARR